MDEGALRLADRLLHDVHEGCDVVVGDGFALEHAGHEVAIDLRCPLPAGGGVGRRDHAEGRPGVDGQQLHFEPESKLGFVTEQRRHLRHGVAGDHALKLVVASVPVVGPITPRTRRTAPAQGRRRHR
jgi:hypothetical protein